MLINTSNKKRARPSARAGLAMLELVMALPILLLVLAIIINFGVAGAWKVRMGVLARHHLRQSAPDRRGHLTPHQDYIPGTPTESTGGVSGASTTLPELDDPRIDKPIARGPLDAIDVSEHLLKPDEGWTTSTARVEKAFPMLSSLRPLNMTAKVSVLEGKWQFFTMGLSQNIDRRIPRLWKTPQVDSLWKNYLNQQEQVAYSPNALAMDPLSRNDVCGDLYPRVSYPCLTDPGDMQPFLDQHIKKITGHCGNPGAVVGVAYMTTQRYLGSYKRRVEGLEKALEDNPDAPGYWKRCAQTIIGRLGPEVEPLEAALKRVPKCP